MTIFRFLKGKYSTYCLIIIFILFSDYSFSQEKIYGLLYSDNQPVSITIYDGNITSIRTLRKLPKGTPPLIIAPGLVDNQVYGFDGVSFSLGSSTELTVHEIRDVTYAIWKTGVTTFIPALMTNDPELIRKNLIVLAHMKDERNLLGSIPGFHLDGPYISPSDGYREPHPLKYLCKPDWKEFLAVHETSGKSILQVTIAPELEGAMEFIDKCRANGIVVALGHHNASAEIITEAIDRGAVIATHIGNGLANTINRHQNPLWPQLSDDRLLVSMICDGFHLRPEEVRVFYKVKGPDRTILASDITGYSSMSPGKYVTSEGDTIELTGEGKLKYPARDVLYGSTCLLKDDVTNVMKLTGCSLADAIKMASANPARLYGLNDRGTIEVGKRADLIMFRMVDSEIIISRTYVKGNLVYDASAGSK